MNRQRGMTLVSQMVGLLIGLLLLLVATASASFFEAQRRISMGNDSALQEVLAGVTDLQREAANAGLGLVSMGALSCTSVNAYFNGAVVADAAPIQPVTIVAGVGGAPDSVSFFSMGGMSAAEGISLTENMKNAHGDIFLSSSGSLVEGGFAMVANPGSGAPCTFGQISNILDLPKHFNVKMNPGVANPWNPPNPAGVFSNAQVYPAGSRIYPVDANGFRWVQYRVRNGVLELVNLATGEVRELATNVRHLSAFYGISPAGGGGGLEWVPATGAWAGALSATNVLRIRAIRVALVGRGQQPQKPATKGAACDASPASIEAWPGGPSYAVPAADRCYRHKRLATVAPLRNVVFGGG